MKSKTIFQNIWSIIALISYVLAIMIKVFIDQELRIENLKIK